MLAWILTLSRLPLSAAFALVVAMACADGQPVGAGWMVAMLVLAVLAEATDLFDGWAARRFGTVSELGGLADPMCDSLGRLTVYFSLALAGWLWIGVPLVMTGRDIVVSYVRIVSARTGLKTSARASGKLKAIVQGAAVFVLLVLASEWVWPGATVEPPDRRAWITKILYARATVGLAVILFTLWSLYDYVRGGWPGIRRMAGSR